MHSSFRYFIVAVIAVLTAFIPLKAVQADPPVIDPFGFVYADGGAHNDISSGLDRIYHSRNQILARITGCQFDARVTDAISPGWASGYCDDGAGNPRHWAGSGMEFIESIVNDLFLGAVTDPLDVCAEINQVNGATGCDTTTPVTVPPQYWNDRSDWSAGLISEEEIFRNYLDLILKRLFDGDKATPLDYDIHTFRYVDSYNPAFTTPTYVGIQTTVPPTTTDTNGDGIEGGWDPAPLLQLCLPELIILGDEVCMSLNIVNIQDSFSFFPGGYSGSAPWGSNGLSAPVINGVTQTNNVGAPMLNFQRYLTTNQAGTSHLFLASEPKRDFTFDKELFNCDVAALISDTSSSCNASPYRDDDDGLYVEIKLVDFEIDLLFEPPFTDAAYGTSQEVWGAQNYRYSTTENIREIPANAPVGTPGQTWVCPEDVAGQRTIVDVTDETSPNYLPACDLSRWLKIRGTARVPELSLGLSMRIVSSYDGGPDFSPADGMAYVTGPVISLGFDLNVIEFSAQFAYVLTGGSYCNHGASYGQATTEHRQGQDYLGVFYDQTDVPNNCAPGNLANPSEPSQFDDASYDKSAAFTSVLSFIRAEVLGTFENFFDPTTNPGFFLGPTIIPGLDDLNDTVAEATGFDWPLSGTSPTNQTDAVWLQLGLSSDVEVYEDLLAPGGATEFVTTRGNGDGMKPNLSQSQGGIAEGDAVNEFWADPWGIAMPFSGGLGVYWTTSTDAAAGTESISCVTADSAYTGYNDGYVSLTGDQPSQADDPSVSRSIPNLSTSWAGSAQSAGAGGAWDSGSIVNAADAGMEYDSMLLHLKIPDVSGRAPYVTAASLKDIGSDPNFNDALVPNTDTAETYAIGLAVHQNLLSKLIYEFVVDGLLCIDINPDAQHQNLLSDLLGDFLTTDSLGLFVPFLANHFPGQNMSVRIVPLLRQPAGKFLPTVRGDYSSTISQFVRDFTNNSSAYGVTQENPIPRIVMGGDNQFDPLKKRFRGQIATRSLIENTCGSNAANPLSDPECGIWPDFSLIIPHMMVEFFVHDEPAPGTVVRRRAFAMDVGVNVGLNIDIVQNPLGGTIDFASSGLYGDAIPNSRPIYGGTDFPIGCDATADQSRHGIRPCDITGVPSRLVIFLGGLLDPELNSILVYDELPGTVTDFTGATEDVSECVDPTNSSTSCIRGNSAAVIDSYENAISNLLGLILSGEISFFAEIGLDPAAFLDLPIILTVPYIGPSFVFNDMAETTLTDLGTVGGAPGEFFEELGCLQSDNSAGCPDPIFPDATAALARDISDGDANGFGDYLVVALGIDISYLETRFLIRLIDTILEPIDFIGNSFCAGEDADGDPATDVVCTSESFNSRLTNLLDSLAGAPGFAPESEGRLPVGYQSPETIIQGVRKAHGFETIIDYEGWHPTVDAGELLFSYRVDGGFWTPFVPATTARIPGLFEGRHVFEVRAMDPDKNVEYTPERIEFIVDSVAPTMKILGNRVQSGIPAYVVDVYDAQTLPEDVRIAYKIGDGEWSAFSYDKEVVLDGVPTGQHVLAVRAMDESGNVGEQVLNIAVEDGGFGCASTTAGGDGMLDLLLILLVPALLIRGRRRKA